MKRSAAAAYSLPEDLMIEILSLLPIKSLLRFKCVCKSWFYLFVCPIFVSKHRHNCNNSVNSDHRRLVLGHKRLPGEYFKFMILSYNTLDVITEDFRFDLYDDYNKSWYAERLLGSYNGLVCVADEYVNRVALWNPATRQVKVVRDCKTATHLREHAFGYDFKTNDYKVMRMTPMTYTRPYRYHIEVYSFSTDSWRDSDAIIPDGFYLDDCLNRPATCVNGVYSTVAYTHAKETEVRNYFLFTVDMSDEVFIVTPMLNEVVTFAKYHHWQFIKALTELKGLVACVLYQTGPSEDERLLISTLNEYGPRGTWTKLYTVAPHSKLVSTSLYRHVPLGFWKNNKLFLDNKNGGLVLCDPRTKEIKEIFMGERYLQILEYKESLVWINEGLGQKKWRDPLRPGYSDWGRKFTEFGT